MENGEWCFSEVERMALPALMIFCNLPMLVYIVKTLRDRVQPQRQRLGPAGWMLVGLSSFLCPEIRTWAEHVPPPAGCCSHRRYSRSENILQGELQLAH